MPDNELKRDSYYDNDVELELTDKSDSSDEEEEDVPVERSPPFPDSDDSDDDQYRIMDELRSELHSRMSEYDRGTYNLHTCNI